MPAGRHRSSPEVEAPGHRPRGRDAMSCGKAGKRRGKVPAAGEPHHVREVLEGHVRHALALAPLLQVAAGEHRVGRLRAAAVREAVADEHGGSRGCGTGARCALQLPQRRAARVGERMLGAHAIAFEHGAVGRPGRSGKPARARWSRHVEVEASLTTITESPRPSLRARTARKCGSSLNVRPNAIASVRSP